MNDNKLNKNSPNSITSPVYNFRELIKLHRKNAEVKGFDFDADTFENLIDCFTPENNIPLILNCTIADLDRFCQELYNQNYKETYKQLIGITDMWMRKAIKGQAEGGNPTALKIAAEHFMDLREQNQADAINITFVNDLEGGEKK